MVSQPIRGRGIDLTASQLSLPPALHGGVFLHLPVMGWRKQLQTRNQDTGSDPGLAANLQCDLPKSLLSLGLFPHW